MSLASNIGCNIDLPIADDEYSEESLYIGSCFANEENLQNVKKYQFSTLYVYEVSSHWTHRLYVSLNIKMGFC